jgi:HD-GYP domain-containing protein (c-di-GMP phosphodiesterase class II)
VDIIMVSDIYDALISQRPYRPESYDNRSALEEITAQASSGKISTDAVQALVALNRTAKPHYTECTLSDERRGSEPAHNVYGVTVSK